MENNENNIQNQVNENQNVNEQNTNQNVSKDKKIAISLIVIILILVLAIGIGAGFLFAGKMNITTNDNTANNNAVETKTGKKIDESKPWVYDAEYLKDKEEKVKTNKENSLTFKSTEQIKLPYININSEDARIANDEIKVFAEKAYADFGKPLQGSDASTKEAINDNDWFTYTAYDYKVYENEKILSIVISKQKVAVPGDGSATYMVYNFDLETLKNVEIDEILQSYGFKSHLDFTDKLNIVLKNSEKKDEGLSPEYTTWDGKRYFVKDNKINLVVPGPALVEVYIEVDPNVVEISGDAEKKETQNKTTSDKNVTKVESKIINEEKLNERQMVVTGINSAGEKVWEYTTLKENCPEESVNRSLKLIGIKNNKVYVCDWGKLYILDEQTGKVLYSNTEVNMGGAAVTAFDDNNNLYTASYLAPLCLFDTEGRIISLTFDLWDNGFYTAKKITIEGDNLIIDYGNDGIATVNRYSLKLQNPKKEKKIVKECIPSGWAGASNNKIVLYDNGDVDYIGYNGSGDTDDCIIHRELIATNATDIENNKEDRPDVTKKIRIKGESVSEVFDLAPDWVEFKK